MATMLHDRSAVDAVRSIPGLRVLVVGDAVLDTYVEGTASRICREAPVPVIEKQGEQAYPGGAANTAANLSALGAGLRFVGLVGDDDAAHRLRTSLREAGVSDRWLVTNPDVSTVRKQRIIAGSQYVARVDEGAIDACTPAGRQAVLDHIERLFPEVDAVILSDYGYGTVSDAVVERLRELRAERRCPLAIDPRNVRRFGSAGATVITPNLQEARDAIAAAGHSADGDPRAIIGTLRGMLDSEYIAVTMAGGGVLLADSDGATTELPTYPLATAGDVGAGDSFASAMTLALAAGAEPATATQIGIDAASIACTRQRTAVVTHRELLGRVGLSQQAGPFAGLSLKEIATRLDAERFAGKRIVFTNGVFDILHAGHVQLLRRARELGDILVVGINSDASVRRLKGSQRPINREQDRLALVSALDAVDYATVFGEDTPAETIRALRPDVHVKGGDYTEDTLPEIGAVREVGARVVILPLLNGHSTTNVIRSILSKPGDSVLKKTS